VAYKRGFGVDDCIYCPLYLYNPGLQAVTALSPIYTLHSSPLPRTSIFLLQWSYSCSGFISLTRLKLHTKSSLHSPVIFLPFILNHLWLPSPELELVFDNWLRRPSLYLYNPSSRTTQETPPLNCWGLFTDTLPSNGCHIARVRLREYVYSAVA
jgi:hypothetical protein